MARLMYKLDILQHTAPALFGQVGHLQSPPLHGSLPLLPEAIFSELACEHHLAQSVSAVYRQVGAAASTSP